MLQYEARRVAANVAKLPESKSSARQATTGRHEYRGGQRTDRPGRLYTLVSSAANAKRARRRLDFDLAPVLGARRKTECAARGLDGNSAATFACIIHKLVEPDR